VQQYSWAGLSGGCMSELLDEKRKALERSYQSKPPLAVIANIAVSALVGSFITTVAIRAIHSNQLPILKFPEQSTNQGQNND